MAIGLPGDVAKEGVAIGWVINSDSERTAHERALRGCLDFKDAPATTRALCKVIKTFRGECVAIALDPEAGTPGVGWAVAVSMQAAETDALAACVSTAGAARQQALQGHGAALRREVGCLRSEAMPLRPGGGPGRKS